MLNRNNRSIQTKLTAVIVGTSVITLLFAAVFLCVYEIKSFKDTTLDGLAAQANLIGNSSSAALTFLDVVAAEEIMSILALEEPIVYAAIYDSTGTRFATYEREAESAALIPETCRTTFSGLDGFRLVHTGKIMLEGEGIGYTMICSDLGELKSRLSRYLIILVFVFILAGLFAFFLSSRAQHIVSTPVLHLVETTRRVATEKNFGLRAEKTASDEIGLLVDSFNEMLQEIEDRDRLLDSHRAELELRISERTRDLAGANKSLAEQLENREQLTMELRMANHTLVSTNDALQKSQNLLVKSEKLASIGTLAAGVAHEINNPLGFISSNSNTLAREMQTVKSVLEKQEAIIAATADERLVLEAKLAQFKEDKDFEFVLDDIDDMLKESSSGIERVRSIVQSLQMFSQTDDTEADVLDLNQCIECSLAVIGSEQGEHCQINKDLAELPLVHGNASALGRAFANILLNAAQAVGADGSVDITSRCEDSGVIVTIRDTGEGIPQENLDKIFDPFFTTRDVGMGTGMGLAVVHGILDRYQATIEVESAVGEGTTFIISFKAVADEGAKDAFLRSQDVIQESPSLP